MSASAVTPVRVHVLRSPEATDELRQLLDPAIELTGGDDALPPPAQIEILIDGRPTREDIEACPGLRMLIIPYAGIPEATRELMLEFPHVAVHNLHHNASAASELAIALFLAAAKRLIPADRALRQGDWSIRYADGGDLLLQGKTALVLGLGAIGSLIARACAGLGMHVIGIRRRLNLPLDATIETHDLSSLLMILPQAAALFVALPLTPETRGLIGQRELTLLGKDAALVNVARGPIVDEQSLFQALSEGRLGAAGLDVWYQYPRDADERTSTFPSTFPFHKLDNVVLSPHRGGAYQRPELERLRIEHLACLLNAIPRGEPIPNRVDIEAGY